MCVLFPSPLRASVCRSWLAFNRSFQKGKTQKHIVRRFCGPSTDTISKTHKRYSRNIFFSRFGLFFMWSWKENRSFPFKNGRRIFFLSCDLRQCVMDALIDWLIDGAARAMDGWTVSLFSAGADERVLEGVRTFHDSPAHHDYRSMTEGSLSRWVMKYYTFNFKARVGFSWVDSSNWSSSTHWFVYGPISVFLQFFITLPCAM